MSNIHEYIDTPSYMEPMLPDGRNIALDNYAVDLLQKSTLLVGKIRPEVADSIGKVIRSMNCYYSNLIEGHNTHPWDIDRALKKDFSDDIKKRNLQLEAKAHIEVQEMIDKNIDNYDVLSFEFISWIHREFCSRLPDELLWIENPSTGKRIKVLPGVLRDGEVKIGWHIPPIASSLPKFLNRFHDAYNPNTISKVQQIIAVAASHHRLLWIHPFYDGNGRVTRLFSHAFLRKIGVGNNLWSISRGLARTASKYKTLLMQADMVRQGDLDGRGNLTLKGLNEFCTYFLQAAIDQVEYMESIIEPNEMLRRIQIYVEEEIRANRLMNGSYQLLREAVLAGAYDRGQASIITGYKERQARSVLADLIKKELLVSDTSKSQVRLNLPINIVDRWFPKLYPTA